MKRAPRRRLHASAGAFECALQDQYSSLQRDSVERAPRLLAASEKTYQGYSIISFTITNHELEVLYPSAIYPSAIHPSAIIRQQKGRQQRGYREPEMMTMSAR